MTNVYGKTAVGLVVLLLAVPTFGQSQAIVDRVGADIEYLASEELEGRGVQTKGIELAAARILEVYREHGLKPAMEDGSFRQPFDVALGATEIASDTSVVLSHTSLPPRTVALKTEFQPLRRGKNGSSTGELVFVGYGITSEEDKYDDYANLDVAGKVLVMIRREPQQGNVQGAFLGTETSTHAYINRKLELAKQHNAAGIIFVNDPFTATSPDVDDLSDPSGFGTNEAGIPFVHVKQAVIDQLLQANPLIVSEGGNEQKLSGLTQVTDFIDRTLTPVSQPLTGWSAEVSTRFEINSVRTFNLIGVLEGEGALADETIVVGAHYDHLGFGGYGSRAKARTGEVHNGADDNASGTAAVLEMVRRLAAGPGLRRRIVFACFSGEERGLLGSYHYVQNPVVPLENTIAMLNFDMVGTLRNNQVEVNGVGTADEFRPIVQAADNALPLRAKIQTSPFAGSDHLPFFRKQIPVMFCFTGVTSRYHTPDDDFETINVPGVVSVVEFSEKVLRGIDALPNRPKFRNVSRRTRRKVPFLGIMPNLGADGDEAGIPIQGIRENSPAAAAGFRVGDSIIKANETEIDDYSDLIEFIRNANAGDQVTFSVRRGEQEASLKATLGAPR